jgi:hypothetical protein
LIPGRIPLDLSFIRKGLSSPMNEQEHPGTSISILFIPPRNDTFTIPPWSKIAHEFVADIPGDYDRE